MEASEQIKKWMEFLEMFCQTQIFEAVRQGKKSVTIDFSELAKFSPDLAEDLLERPEDTLKAGEISLQQFETPKKEGDLKIRLENVPESQKIMIRNIRSEHLNKLLIIEGLVRQKSDVRPQIVSAKFECPSCGNIISALQSGISFKEPTRCSCGRQGKFKLVSKELIDAQGLVLEETPEQLEGGEQPKRINVLLKDELVSPISEKKTNPGNKIQLIGWVKEVPIVLKSGKKSLKFDFIVEANNLFSKEGTFFEISLTEEDEKQITELSKDVRIGEKLISSIAPSIFGYEEVKEALLLQLFGGVQKTRRDGTVSRGDIHILLVGDPGSGKSQILKRITIVAPKGRYVSGKGVSGAGVTASVVKDEFLGGWSLEAGALVLANKGICCIDELDKMSVEDRSAMHEALEQQTVSISKATIQATLMAETTVLAAANPKFGRFESRGTTIAKQIDLPPTLINRFDLIFPIMDLPDRKKDEKMAKHILGLHQHPETELEVIPTPLLRKYIAYAKQRIRPVLTEAALDEIRNYYVELRSTELAEVAAEGGARTVPISPRQLDALVRIAEASAKIRLSERVTKRDARKAIELLNFSLSQVARDKETGRIDIDIISTGIAATEREKITKLKEIIEMLEERFGKTIDVSEIAKAAEEQQISRSETEEMLEKLKRSGDIFEPKHGFIQKL